MFSATLKLFGIRLILTLTLNYYPDDNLVHFNITKNFTLIVHEKFQTNLEFRLHYNFNVKFQLDGCFL